MAIDYRLYTKYAGRRRDPVGLHASALAVAGAVHSAHQCLTGRNAAETYRDMQAIGLLTQVLIIAGMILYVVYGV